MDLKEKFLNKQELTSDEVEKIIWNMGAEGITCIGEIKGGNDRWTRTNLFIFEVDGRYFQLKYAQGLTECQENEYWAQTPIEVKKVEKTIVVTDWEEIKREELLHDFLEKYDGVESLAGADILKYEKDIKKLSDAFHNVEIEEN